MIHQVLDNIYKIILPIPFPLKTINVYFIDEAPRTLVDAGIKTKASSDTLISLGEKKHPEEKI